MNPTTLFPSLWHRRAASVIIMVSITELGLFAYSYLAAGGMLGIVTYEAIAAAGLGLILAFVARLPVPERVASWVSFLGFAFVVAATEFSLMSNYTAGIHVVMVLLLSLLSIIAGLFGPIAWLILIGILLPYVITYFTGAADRSLTGDVSFILFSALPIVASWLLWHGGPRRPNAATGSQKDHTYSTLAEQLNQVSNESEIVISTITDGVVALSQKGEIQLINPAAQKMLGWNKHDSLGLDYRSIIKLQDKQGNAIDENTNPIRVALHTVKPLERSDLSMETNSGKVFQARVSITPVGTMGDGVIVVFRDITAEKAEEREQAEFISTASHEMRTPVATIEGYLGLALNPNTAAIDDKARMFLTKAHESAQHLGRLFQDLLDVTKADDGRLRNMPGVVDLVAFCGDIVNGLQTKANEKGLTLAFAPLADTAISERKLTPVFYADVDNDHLREIMNNLVENAIKYTKSGTVTVNVSGDNESCIITVKDSGIGIPREDIPHLFQKFYRVDNSDTREIGGTGLGLYLCRRLVELIGGKIWVESEYGHGSTFTVSLPRIGFDEARSRLAAMEEQRQRQFANQVSKGEAPVAPAPAPQAVPMPSPQSRPAVAPVPVQPQVQTPAPQQSMQTRPLQPIATAVTAPAAPAATAYAAVPRPATVQPAAAPVQPAVQPAAAPRPVPVTQSTAAPVQQATNLQPTAAPQQLVSTPAQTIPQPQSVAPAPSVYAMSSEVRQQLTADPSQPS